MRSMQANIYYPKTGRIDSIEKAFVEVILGRSSAKCKYFGICKMKRIHTNGLNNVKSLFWQTTDKLFALANLKKGVYIELVFERDSIPSPVYEYHFKNGVFTIEENYTIDLGLTKSPIVIRTGAYNIKFSDTLLTVRFRI